jgi:hypothetical protein
MAAGWTVSFAAACSGRLRRLQRSPLRRSALALDDFMSFP